MFDRKAGAFFVFDNEGLRIQQWPIGAIALEVIMQAPKNGVFFVNRPTPTTYELGGIQYVSILGGRYAQGRLYTLALDVKAPMPTFPGAALTKGKGGAPKGKL